MERIKFSEINSDKIYGNYIQEVRKVIKTLPESDQEDILMEINSHIYESLQEKKEGTETERLSTTLKCLGEPKETLSSLVAERKLSQATRTFNPKHILKALSLNLSKGFIYIVFSILYLFIFCLVFLIIMKFIYPENVGLFTGENEFHFGWISGIEEKNLIEVLKNWFIPVIILIIGILYFFVTFLLRLKYKLNLKK